MTFFGRLLVSLHRVSVAIITVTLLMGYGVSWGYVDVGRHILYGFITALAIAFTHAMTMFYFVGMGVSMREAGAGRPWCRRYLEGASELRRQIAAPLGLAIVSLMAAVILGGGSHTRRLPGAVHHSAAVAALLLNLYANIRAIRAINANERLVSEIDERLRRGE